MIELVDVQPERYVKSMAFVTREGECKLEEVDSPIYPIAYLKRGTALRVLRDDLNLWVREAAFVLGVSISDLSDLELGHKTPAEGDAGYERIANMLREAAPNLNEAKKLLFQRGIR